MHVRIERLYEVAAGKLNLSDREQSHMTRCSFCVMWLDALRRRKAKAGKQSAETRGVRGVAKAAKELTRAKALKARLKRH